MSRKAAAVVMVLGLAAVLPGSAAASSLDLRIGGFFPSADTNLFDDDAELYLVGGDTLTDGRWRGIYGGVEFSAGLGDHVELGFHVDGYGRSLHTSYRDFERPSGREIQQTLKLTVVPVGVTLRLVAGGPRSSIVPYAAVGADLFYYKYEEFGEFIDFDSPSLPVFDDAFISEGVAPGFHVAAGLRIPLSRDFSLVGEGRYQFAKDDMGDDFRGNRIDLGGASATLGLHVRF